MLHCGAGGMSEYNQSCVPAQVFLIQTLKCSPQHSTRPKSFQTLQYVAVKTLQFGLNFGHAFVWQVMRLGPVTMLAAALPPPRPFPWNRHGSKKPAQ